MATGKDGESKIGISTGAYKCHPCDFHGKSRPVAGCCVNCREYLCQECYVVHRIPSVTRNHVLLDKYNMIELDQEKDNIKEMEGKHMCEQHKDKQIEYHCPTHSFLGCHICCYQHQQSCQNVICIPKVCTLTENMEEYCQFNQRLENISTKCNEFQAEIKSNLQRITCNNLDAVTAIKTFKIEIVDMVNKLEQEVIEYAESVKTEKTQKMNDLSEQVEALDREREKIKGAIDLLQNNEKYRDLYIMLVQTKDQVSTLEKQVQTSEGDLKIKHVMFQKNIDLTEILKSPMGMGSLSIRGSIEKVKHYKDINYTSKDDVGISCIVRGLVLLDSQKILMTYFNGGINSAKLIDIQQNCILSDLTLSSEPRSVCKINETDAAVTLPTEKQVVFLKIDPVLSVDRVMEVDGKPKGIGYLDGKLVVSYNSPKKVEIMNTQGKVINVFDKDNNGQSLFSSVSQLAINPNNKLIYVSNYKRNNVICMRFDGTVIASYSDPELKHPVQVTFDSFNRVYIAGDFSNNLHQITEDCKKLKVLYGFCRPTCIYFHEKESIFLIGHCSHDKIKMYQIEYTNL